MGSYRTSILRKITYSTSMQSVTRIPFGLLFTSDAISRFKSAQVFGVSSCCNHEHMGYQSHMGFFKACGFDYGTAPHQWSQLLAYHPLGCGDAKEGKRARDFGDRDVIQEHSDRMAEVLSRLSIGDVYETLAYSLREVIRNVVEHSESDTVQFCAQHWPTKNCVHRRSCR